MSYSVAVRSLCEFAAKSGDLDLRFTPAPSAQEGIAGHQLVASRRGSDYETEIVLRGEFDVLEVRGRADGFDPSNQQLEEIKTYRGDLSRMPDNHRQLHWAQVKIYGALLCRQRGLTHIRLALVYLEVDSQRETLLRRDYHAEELQQFFAEQCRCFLQWARQEIAHRDSRDQRLNSLPFPYANFRSGQRQLAEAVYKSVRLGHSLLAEAPTGIGKTLGTLFPLLKAMPLQPLDKVFFLTAKTPGRQLVLDALEKIRAEAAEWPLRVLELVARDKACEYPAKACHGQSCPLAQGFYDRLPQARQAAVASAYLDRENLRRIAREHQVCPYYLGQELARWADLIVGDYNYFFDLSALLHGLTVANDWQVAVLVDEAHNLVERARAMYSAELDPWVLRQARTEAPKPLKKCLQPVRRAWQALAQELTGDYKALDQPPKALLQGLQSAIARISDYWSDQPDGLGPALQRFYFDALQFCQIAERFDTHSIFDLQSLETRTGPVRFRASEGSSSARQPDMEQGQFWLGEPDAQTVDGPSGDNPLRKGAAHPARGAKLCLRNLVPASFLAPRYGAARACVLFSATLKPQVYYRDLLGLPADCRVVDIDSPFTPEQLAVHLVDQISTRYRQRQTSIQPITQLMAQQFYHQPGNYLAFFSSFDYLQQVADALAEQCPEIPQWRQAAGMDEASRSAFLARFNATGQGIGFAVLGGAFGEAIDLPGERLIGAFIATLGLPQWNPVNEQRRLRLQQLYGCGYDYSYLYPGLQKVIQAAGRVIRRVEDRGVIYLIDDRFGQPQIRQLLPRWWQITRRSAFGLQSPEGSLPLP